MSNLIKSLEERYTRDTTPDVATTVTQGLNQLSSGIYTEEERFVFELLQNAVDAYSEDGTLRIKIVIKDDHLLFLHNGSEFSERDIKGLCDIGNGNKTTDSKKIGYKGIGFKSVFMRSSCVTVQTGDNCFKFDKNYWTDYWKNNWKSAYGKMDDEKNYLMPWQIIPIATTKPVDYDTKDFNVVTYIQLDKTQSISEKIMRLLDNSQFLLFLRCKNIKVEFECDGRLEKQVEKTTNSEIVNLSVNGVLQSQWLIYTNNEVPVPEDLRTEIDADINTPDKLKSAQTFDLSFAIALSDNGKLKAVKSEDAFVYTYLPTSFKFGGDGFPFLVNANFITDAGRQQLHKDSAWNKLIFSKIPSEYLSWIAELSSKYKNYYEVLPKREYGNSDALQKEYANQMDIALATIAFIPTRVDSTIKTLAKDAVMDLVGIADAISTKAFIAHINRAENHSFTEQHIIAPIWKGFKKFESYGVYIFDKSKLNTLFNDEQAFSNLTTDLNITLIKLLYDYYQRSTTDKEELVSVLQDTRFLLSDDNTLASPKELFFPSTYDGLNQYQQDIHYLNTQIYENIDLIYIKWLTELGINELSDLTFINEVICQPGYITQTNAIEVIRYLFQTSKKINIFDEVENDKISRLKYLTKQGTLGNAENLFLGSLYKPTVDLEKVYDADIYISEDYIESKDEIEDWTFFFKKMGVNSTLDWKQLRLDLRTQNWTQNFDLLAWVKRDYDTYAANSGPSYWTYYVEYFKVYYAPFILTQGCPIEFEKLIWSSLLKDKYSVLEDAVVGYSGSWGKTKLFSEYGHCSFIEWAFKNYQQFPSSDGRKLFAKQMFKNATDIKELAGKYLPIIDLDCEIHESWNEILSFKNQLELDDYLCLLENISQDSDNVENNKERISKIYQRLVELDCTTSPAKKEKIAEWAQNHTILSRDGKFLSPTELSHVTLDGFNSANRVYIGSPSNREKVIELLALMGVKLITEQSIHPDFGGTEQEESTLKDILLSKISPLALISAGENATYEEYTEKKHKLQKKLLETKFYHCEKIKLTYGNNDDTLERHTFGKQNEFYYIGDLRPANVEPLLTPLAKYLNIGKKERELFILFIEDWDGVTQNLKDKGYETDYLEKPEQPDSGTIDIRNNYAPTLDQEERNRITGFKGEIIVYERLKAMGYTPKCPAVSEEFFEEATEIEMNGKTYYCVDNYSRYDIEFEAENGKTIYVEVKATTKQKGYIENMPISSREWSMVDEYNYSEDSSYLIMRVFDVNGTPDIYVMKAHLLES